MFFLIANPGDKARVTLKKKTGLLGQITSSIWGVGDRHGYCYICVVSNYTGTYMFNQDKSTFPWTIQLEADDWKPVQSLTPDTVFTAFVVATRLPCVV